LRPGKARLSGRYPTQAVHNPVLATEASAPSKPRLFRLGWESTTARRAPPVPRLCEPGNARAQLTNVCHPERPSAQREGVEGSAVGPFGAWIRDRRRDCSSPVPKSVGPGTPSAWSGKFIRTRVTRLRPRPDIFRCRGIESPGLCIKPQSFEKMQTKPRPKKQKIEG
jgi:hypothetical protein